MTAGLLLTLALLWLGQRRLIYFPSSAVPSVASVLPSGKPVVFTTDDGLQLDGWFLLSVGPGAGTAYGAVLVCNGNDGNRFQLA